MFALLQLQPDLYSSIKYAAFGVGIDLGEGRVLVRGKDDLAVAALALVEDIFRVDEQAEFAERLFAEEANFDEASREAAVVERLSAAVIEFGSRLKVFVFLKHERGIYAVGRQEREFACARQIACLAVR